MACSEVPALIAADLSSLNTFNSLTPCAESKALSWEERTEFLCEMAMVRDYPVPKHTEAAPKISNHTLAALIATERAHRKDLSGQGQLHA